jgi:hypothetical protein
VSSDTGAALDLSDPLVHDFRCPHCDVELETGGWYIPGMRKLAELECPSCDREFYGDLPAGFGLHHPMLLDRRNGSVTDRYGIDWYASLLRDSYAERSDDPPGLGVTEHRPTERAVLINCLDINYGHVVQKLLHAGYYLSETDLDVVVLVPSFVEWLVPSTVSETWTVDLSLSECAVWNDRLADDIEDRVAAMEECYLDIGSDQVHPGDYCIADFTDVDPFPMDEFTERADPAVVTFVWRDKVEHGSAARLWCSTPDETRSTIRNLLVRPRREVRGMVNLAANRYGHAGPALRQQRRRIVETASRLRDAVSDLDVAVAGIGTSGQFPDWLTDLRVENPDTESERELCERYARSHIVVGMHGSQMVLPSAHAGIILELVQDDKWRHYGDDIAFRDGDPVGSFLRHALLPAETAPSKVAHITADFLRFYPELRARNRRTHDLDAESILSLHDTWEH